MNLSEAIREGAKKRPQGFGVFLRAGSSCAMGAAAEGIGLLLRDGCGPEPYGKYMALVAPFTAHYRTKQTPCPADGCGRLGDPTHLNDDHRWTREAIADWLEGLGL